MYNYFLLIGRIARDIELKQLQDGRKVINLVLAVQRPFKNQDGNYDTDFLKVTIWEQMADIVAENVRKGAQIGVKGRLCTRREILDGGVPVNTIELVGDRILFFSNLDQKPQDQKEES